MTISRRRENQISASEEFRFGVQEVVVPYTAFLIRGSKFHFAAGVASLCALSLGRPIRHYKYYFCKYALFCAREANFFLRKAGPGRSPPHSSTERSGVEGAPPALFSFCSKPKSKIKEPYRRSKIQESSHSSRPCLRGWWGRDLDPDVSILTEAPIRYLGVQPTCDLRTGVAHFSHTARKRKPQRTPVRCALFSLSTPPKNEAISSLKSRAPCPLRAEHPEVPIPPLRWREGAGEEGEAEGPVNGDDSLRPAEQPERIAFSRKGRLHEFRA